MNFYNPIKFYNEYKTEEQCEEYVLKMKYPNGFLCKKCNHNKYNRYRLKQGFVSRNTHLGLALGLIGEETKVYQLPFGFTFGNIVYFDISGLVNIYVQSATVSTTFSGSASIKVNIADHLLLSVSFIPLFLPDRDAFEDFIVPYGFSFAY